jgi:hypothetical protein
MDIKPVLGMQNGIPVLVELRFWQGSIVDLIRDFFKRHGLLLDRPRCRRNTRHPLEQSGQSVFGDR